MLVDGIFCGSAHVNMSISPMSAYGKLTDDKYDGIGGNDGHV